MQLLYKELYEQLDKLFHTCTAQELKELYPHRIQDLIQCTHNHAKYILIKIFFKN